MWQQTKLAKPSRIQNSIGIAILLLDSWFERFIALDSAICFNLYNKSKIYVYNLDDAAFGLEPNYKKLDFSVGFAGGV